jgi:copper(I)-binding protein
MIRRALLFIITGLMPQVAAAEIIAEDAWVRLPPPVADTAAGYLILRNTGDAPVELIGAESPVSDTVAFHHMSMQKGMMHMKQMKKLTVPAHGSVIFASGGNHLMLTGLKEPLQAGDSVHITFHLSEGTTVDIAAEVRDMRQMQGHSH